MRIPYPPRYQWIGFFCSMPFITFSLLFIMYEQRVWHELNIWLIGYPIIYVLGYISWRSHYVYDHFIQSKLPTVEETRKRVLLTIPVNVLVMTPSVLLIFFVFHWFHILGYHIQSPDLTYGYLVGLSVNVLFESLWEVMFIIGKSKEAAAEKEMVERMQLHQEFDLLKRKVNPHFLFNSFNTLSSLITEDKDRAEKFLDELSKVYRYLLRNNESGMSTVEQEVKFIQSYATLLKTRFGDGFKLDMQIDPAVKDKEIPSLSLQLLVENAVKHNIISKAQPVTVEIHSGNGYLSITNNLNKKARGIMESTGIGLSNIREKYRLLNRTDVRIEETANQFVVILPLLP